MRFVADALPVCAATNFGVRRAEHAPSRRACASNLRAPWSDLALLRERRVERGDDVGAEVGAARPRGVAVEVDVAQRAHGPAHLEREQREEALMTSVTPTTAKSRASAF